MRLYIKITLQRIFFIVLLLNIGCEDLLETKDTSPPLITITSPNFNSTVSEIVSIQLMVTDDNDIEYVQVWNNDGILGEANLVSNSIYSYYWDTNSLENGDYTIFAIASDGTNETSSSPLTINVENFVEITINNNTHDQAIYILGSENGIITSGTSKSISLLNDTGNIEFTASVGQYTPCGLELYLDLQTINVSTQDITLDLDVDGSFYFLYITNSSYAYVNDIYINWLQSSEISCSLNLPNDNNEYPIGFYERISSNGTSQPNTLDCFSDDYWISSWSYNLYPQNNLNEYINVTLNPLLNSSNKPPAETFKLIENRFNGLSLTITVEDEYLFQSQNN